MGSLRNIVLAGAAVIVSIPAANAADLPPIIQRAPPVPVEEYGGWYLRGDIGFSNEQLRTFREDGLNPVPDSVQNASSGFDGGEQLRAEDAIREARAALSGAAGAPLVHPREGAVAPSESETPRFAESL